jgi:biopolymer transport protein ExbB
MLDEQQKYSGTASVRVTLDQKFNPAMPGWGLKIREKPGPGEYRYLRYAWKKQGGAAICLQLNHDGGWGPAGAGAPSFRYSAGPALQVFGASLTVDAALPEEWEVVTRDLFADFGEFTLTGIALSPVDGEFGLYDHMYLGTSVEDFKLVTP